MKNPARPAALLLAALLLLPLAACSKDTGDGKVISYPIDTAPRRLDPAIAGTAEELLVINNCFEGLVRQDADGTLAPGAAKSWEISPDGLTYTFRLREDNRWKPHPAEAKQLLGEEAYNAFDTRVTAEDFRFGLARALDPATKSPGADALYAIKNARAVHEGKKRPEELGVEARELFTLVITLERPSATFLYALTHSAAMPCNQAYFEATKGRYGLSPRHLLCNGPLYLSSLGGNLARLRRNDGYREDWATGPAAVNLRVQPSMETRLQYLGEEDGYDAVPVPAALLADGEADAYESVLLQNAALSLLFNCGGTPLNDTKLRAALCAALDTAALGMPAPGALLTDGLRVGGEGYRALAGLPRGIAHDMDRARQLLKECGLDGKLRLTLLCAPQHDTLLRRVLQQWQSLLGLTLEARIETLEPEELLGRLRGGDYDIALAALPMGSSSALEALRGLAESGGAGNWMRYSSNTLDALLRDAAQTADAESCAAACLRAEEHLLLGGVVYPLMPQAGLLLLAPGVQDLVISPAGDQIFFGYAKKF